MREKSSADGRKRTVPGGTVQASFQRRSQDILPKDQEGLPAMAAVAEADREQAASIGWTAENNG